uniref:hypothetical protein n=1 Tax=Amycolatopsis sp. CA-290885 TaxID=3239925 RepID=UPI003F493C1E
MTTTTRTIEEILQLRLRAAELRVMERAVALVKAQEPFDMPFTGEREQEQYEKAVEAKQAADDALALVKREIEAQKGLIETVDYVPDSTFGARRYAAVLMFDNPDLTPGEARAQARADETARFDEYTERVFGDEDDDDNEG